LDISFEIGTGKINLRVTVLCNTPQGILVEKYKNDFYFPIGGRIKLHEDSLIAAQRELYENIDLRPMKIKDIVNGNITLPFHLTIRD
jgi:8-oxo-dGTP pyrophosphatase MutT (NUDIX family)